MTSVEEHKKKIEEHLGEIEDAIEEGIEKKPATIGFHCSACSIQLLELYLHVLNKIPVGKVLKHDRFKKPKPEQKIKPLIERKLQIEFPQKQQIYNLIYEIEENRNNLVYGKSGKEQIKKVLDYFLRFREIIFKLLENEGFKIEE